MPLHTDAPDAQVTMPDGRTVRNLTDAEYEASYGEGEPHRIPDDVLAAAIERANARGL